MVLFFNYGLDTGTVWKSTPNHEPILWRHVSWGRQSPDGQSKEQSRWGWLFYRRVKTGKAFYRPINRLVHAHLKNLAPANPDGGAPVFLGGGARPNSRFQELCVLASIQPRKNVETGEDEPWELKDLRKTCATYYDEHVHESSIEILGHSVGGITYRHSMLRALAAYILQGLLRGDGLGEDKQKRRKELLEIAKSHGRGAFWKEGEVYALATGGLQSMRRIDEERVFVTRPFETTASSNFYPSPNSGRWTVVAYLPHENEDSRSWLRELELIHHHRPPDRLRIVVAIPEPRDEVKKLQRGRESWHFIAKRHANELAREIGAEWFPEVYVLDTQGKPKRW